MPQYVQQEQYTPFVRPYVEGPVKEYAALQKQLIEDYDATALQYDALQEAKDNMKYASFDPASKQRVEMLMKNAESIIAEAAKSGDYENRSRIVRKAISDFKTGYEPVYNKYKAYQENVSKILERTDINEPEKRNRLAALIPKYNQVEEITYDKKGLPVISEYKSFNPMKDIDVTKKLADIADKIRAKEYKNLPYLSEDGRRWISQSGKLLKKEEIQRILMPYAEDDPEIKAYLNQEAELFAASTDDSVIPEVVKEKYYSKYQPKNEQEAARLNEFIKKDMFKNQQINKHVINTSDIFDINNVMLDAEFDPEYKAYLESSGASKFKESLNSLAQGTTEVNSATLLNKKQAALELQAASSNLLTSYEQARQEVNINTTQMGSIMRELNAMQSSGVDINDVKAAVDKLGYNLKPEQLAAIPNLISKFKEVKTAKRLFENSKNVINNIQKEFEKSDFDVNESYGNVNNLSEYNFNSNKFQNKQVFSKEAYKGLLDKAADIVAAEGRGRIDLTVGNLPENTKQLVDAVKKANPKLSQSEAIKVTEKLLDEGVKYNDKLTNYLQKNKDLTSQGYLLINPNKESHAGAVSNNLTETFKAVPETMTVNGLSIRQYLDSKGLTVPDGGTVNIVGDVIPYINRVGGKDAARVKVEVKDKEGKSKGFKEVDIDLPTQGLLVDDMLRNVYASTTFNKTDVHKGYAQSQEQVKANVAKGYADRKIQNLEDIYDLEATKSGNVVVNGSGNNEYKVTKTKHGTYLISLKGQDDEKNNLVRDFYTKKELASLEEVKEYLGRFELGDIQNYVY